MEKTRDEEEENGISMKDYIQHLISLRLVTVINETITARLTTPQVAEVTHQLVKVDGPVSRSPANSVRVPCDVGVGQRHWVVIEPALVQIHVLRCDADRIANRCSVNQT